MKQACDVSLDLIFNDKDFMRTYTDKEWSKQVVLEWKQDHKERLNFVEHQWDQWIKFKHRLNDKRRPQT